MALNLLASGLATEDLPDDPGKLTSTFQEHARGVVEAVRDNKIEEVSPVIDDSILPGALCDSATDDDRIGFTPYVKAVAAFLTHRVTQPPLTMSIEGEWGCGKTSFMKQLQNELKKPVDHEGDGKQDGFVTVWFNPWRHDREESLWSAFALQSMDDIGREVGVWRRWVSGHFRLACSRYNWKKNWGAGLVDLLKVSASIGLLLLIAIVVLSVGLLFGPRFTQALIQYVDLQQETVESLLLLVGTAGTAGPFILAIVQAWRKYEPKLRAPLASDLLKHIEAPDYASKIAFVEQFHRDFAKILRAFLGERKVAVFIDDLDRCEVPKAAELMQALNLMITDDPQMMFIIGMDRQKVAAGLAAKHKEVLRYMPRPTSGGGEQRSEAAVEQLRGLEFGYNFIEKFIQVPFMVPSPKEDQVLELLFEKDTGGSAVHTDKAGTVQLNNVAGQQPNMDPVPGTATKPDTTTNEARSRGPEVGAAGVEPARAEQERQQRYRKIRLSYDTDSERIRRICCDIAAPALGYNPRRLKQFLSLLRLRFYIAVQTGLFDQEAGQEPADGLTLEQLGKFITLSLRWPLLLADIQRRHGLLRGLQLEALDREQRDPRSPIHETEVPSELASGWLARPGVQNLFLAGCMKRDKNGIWLIEEDAVVKRYSLAEVDVGILLAVSTPPPPELLVEGIIPVREQTMPQAEAESEGVAESVAEPEAESAAEAESEPPAVA